jgi:hypothetical protein
MPKELTSMPSENGAKCLGYRLRTISTWAIVLIAAYLLLRPVWTLLAGGPVDWLGDLAVALAVAGPGLALLIHERQRSKAQHHEQLRP